MRWNSCSLTEILHEQSIRQDSLTIPLYVAKILTSFIWKRSGSAITNLSWMTVSMAILPRFSDFYFEKRVWKFASFNELFNRSMDELQINEDL